MEKNLEKYKNKLDPKNNKEYNKPVWQIWNHKRYVVSILSFMGFMNIYALRTNLSIAIVDMTTLKNVTLENGTTISKREFDWDSTLQGYVLSSFFYGYILTQLLGGYLAAKLVGTKIFGFGIAATAFFTLITPWVAKTNVYFFIAIRTIEGACEGVTYPAIQEVWANWAPPSEKSKLMSISVSGAYFGEGVALAVCSLLATNFGWETISYFFGVVGLVWYFFWVIFIRDTPFRDSRINPEELIYITESIRSVKSDGKAEVPWFKLLTSIAVITHVICLTCETWGFYTMLTYLPQMMSRTLLGFNLNKAGILSALPYLAMGIVVQVSGQVADVLSTKGYLSSTWIRKWFVIIGVIGQPIFILLTGYWVSQSGTPICLIVAVGLGGMAISSATVNPIDIAPKCASVIMGISNTLGSIPGIVSPILTGYIVTDSTSISQWRTVFFIASGIYLFGAITSLLFTSGVRQPWAESNENNANQVIKVHNYDNKNLQLQES